MPETVSIEDAERILWAFDRNHAGHAGADAWAPRLGEVQTWCEECKEGERYLIAGHREAVAEAMRNGASGF